MATNTNILLLLITTLLIITPTTPKTPTLDSGKLYLQVKQTPTSSPELFQLSYDSSIKSELKLTQSSKIEIQAKVWYSGFIVLQMKFGVEGFDPELFSFRLVHDRYDKLTQPVKAVYDSESESWKCVIDLGDPRTVQPYSDLYRLEIAIADEKLPQRTRSTLATIRLTFRHSLPSEKIPTNNTPISYLPSSIIQTKAPETRIDPPSTFTIFILLFLTIVSVLFYYGFFVYLGVNFKLLPRDGVGLLLNLGLIGLLGVNLVFLGKFWLQWNFITTISNFVWLAIVTALVANYALLYLKNRR